MAHAEHKGTGAHDPKRDLRGIADLRPGDHLCIIYRTEDEHRTVLGAYLRRGLEAGERVLYIADARTARQIRGYLRDAGIDVRDAEKRGQLRFLTQDEMYMREGGFDPQGMIALLREETQRALDDGFTGLRVTGEMTWALRGLPGSERLIEYEAKLNEFFPGSACTGLCQYDARRFSPDVLLDVLRTHPIAIVGTQLHHNFYYVPPRELLGGRAHQAMLERWLASLERNEALLSALRTQARALEERVKELTCLKRVRELTARAELSLPEILAASVDLIRSGWRWPDLAQARVEYEGKVYASEGFTDTPWRQSAPLKCEGETVGKVEVAYPDPPPAPEPFLPEEQELLSDIAGRLSQTIQLRRERERLLHLNAVLRAIRNVNQLIVRESDVGTLIQKACELLVEARGVVCSWIVLLDEDGRPMRWAGTGTADEMEELISSWKRAGPPPCVRQALADGGLTVMELATAPCPTCPMAVHYGLAVGLAMRLEHEGHVHGVLVAGVPTTFTAEPDELRLFQEIAGDLAYAISMIRTGQARQEAERRLAQLMGNLPGMAYRCRSDRHWTMEFVSEGCRDLLGYAPEALVGNRDVAYGDLIHPDDRQQVWDTIQKAIARHEPFTVTYRVRTAAGEEKWVWEKGIAVAGEDGEVTLEGFITDITERVQAQAALRESEERYRTLFERTNNPILVIDRQGNYIAANEAALAFLECARKELVGKNVADTIPPGVDATDALRPHRDLWERGGRIETDYWVNGELKTLDLTITPGTWKGRPVVWGLGTDITERKRAEERQARLLQRLTVLHRVAQEITRAAWDPEQVYSTIHRAVAELMPAEAFVISLHTGEDEAEAVYLVDEGGRHPPERVPRGEGMTWQVLSTGSSVLVPDAADGIPFKERRFGSKKSVRSIIAVPLRVGETTVGMLSTQSYGPRAFAEEDLQILEMLAAHAGAAIENARLVSALRESEERFRRLAENAPDLIYRYRLKPSPGFEYVSPSATRITGYTPEEHYADPELGLKLVHPDDRPVLEALRAGEGFLGSPVQFRWVRKDGQIIWTEQINIPVYDEKGELVVIEGIARDITERKKAEDERLTWSAAVEGALYQLVDTLASAMELRDPYTAGHQRRVAELACAIAEDLNLPEERVHGLRVAALLHDIGKALFVPTEILSKPGKLTELEIALIREHPRAGYDVLKGVEFPWPVAEAVHQHHERVDGSGYPRGLKGDEILLEARILAVADVVEAMSSHRPYRPAHPLERALVEVRTHRGVLYDPAVVDACLNVFRKGFAFSVTDSQPG